MSSRSLTVFLNICACIVRWSKGASGQVGGVSSRVRDCDDTDESVGASSC